MTRSRSDGNPVEIINDGRADTVGLRSKFTEGYDTADLQDAKVLLDELKSPLM